jgi:hypothetical protein
VTRARPGRDAAFARRPGDLDAIALKALRAERAAIVDALHDECRPLSRGVVRLAANRVPRTQFVPKPVAVSPHAFVLLLGGYGVTVSAQARNDPSGLDDAAVAEGRSDGVTRLLSPVRPMPKSSQRSPHPRALLDRVWRRRATAAAAGASWNARRAW